jgi:hypothetical protein
LLAVLVLGAACEGGTSGSVTGSRQSCKQVNRSGRCSGSFKSLKGTYSVEIEDEAMPESVPVEVQASVTTGALKVWIKTPEGGEQSVDVPAGGSATLQGVADGEWDDFSVYFEAVGEQAEGVTYEITYDYR